MEAPAYAIGRSVFEELQTSISKKKINGKHRSAPTSLH
jgi:hypothetical protein